MLGIVIAFLVRALLVALFLPFSALDKILNTREALKQCAQAVRGPMLSTVFLAAGFCIEVSMSLAILSGFSDRLAALVLAAYCAATALLWKQFWRTPDFGLQGLSQGRQMFWDFLKNLALAGGFLLLTFGATGDGVMRFLNHPLASSHPYTIHPERDPAP